MSDHLVRNWVRTSLSPRCSPRIGHRKALTEKTWEDTAQGLRTNSCRRRVTREKTMPVIHGMKKRRSILVDKAGSKEWSRKINRQIHYLSPSSDSVFLIMRFMWESGEKTSFKFAVLDLPIQTLPRFCQLLTGTGLQKSVNTAGKDALR